MRIIITLLLGLIIGAGTVYYFFVGAPRVTQMPGAPVSAPDASSDVPGTAVLTLGEPFFNTLLATIFQDLGNPVFQLANNQNEACLSRITLAPEGSGVQTGVRIADGKIFAPLAFSGTYNSQFGCLNFRGAAQANVELRFDQAQQTLLGIINVEAVNLEAVEGLQIAGLAGFLNGPITQFVQNAINERVNPLRILGSEQMNLVVPVAATGGTLRTNVKDVRAEITDALRLHVTYDFSGTR